MAVESYAAREALAHTSTSADGLQLAASHLEALLSRRSAMQAVERAGIFLPDLMTLCATLGDAAEQMDALCLALGEPEHDSDDDEARELDRLASEMDVASTRLDGELGTGMAGWAERLRSAADLRRIED